MGTFLPVHCFHQPAGLQAPYATLGLCKNLQPYTGHARTERARESRVSGQPARFQGFGGSLGETLQKRRAASLRPFREIGYLPTSGSVSRSVPSASHRRVLRCPAESRGLYRYLLNLTRHWITSFSAVATRPEYPRSPREKSRRAAQIGATRDGESVCCGRGASPDWGESRLASLPQKTGSRVAVGGAQAPTIDSRDWRRSYRAGATVCAALSSRSAATPRRS